MNHRLYMDATQHEVYRSLPDKARDRVARFLVDTLTDPIAATEPYGDVDDGVVRLWAAGDLAIVLLVGQETKTVTVLSIAYAGLE
ncbi:type II toxin-antitoxin system RelE family toxin [Streptomyces sp. NPDC002172]